MAPVCPAPLPLWHFQGSHGPHTLHHVWRLMLPSHRGNPPAPLLGTKSCCASDHHAWVWVMVLETLAASLTLQILLFQDEEDKTPTSSYHLHPTGASGKFVSPVDQTAPSMEKLEKNKTETRGGCCRQSWPRPLWSTCHSWSISSPTGALGAARLSSPAPSLLPPASTNSAASPPGDACKLLRNVNRAILKPRC